ncbi:MAG: hypothetical protein ACKVOR_06085 [Flavobacteriales bacterium]
MATMLLVSTCIARHIQTGLRLLPKAVRSSSISYDLPIAMGAGFGSD